MSSIIKVNTYKDANGNALFSSDGSGNVTLSAGAMKNTPAFEGIYNGGGVGFTSATMTKVQINAEVFDTDGCYDHTTNYRFTPTTAGKYLMYGQVFASTGTNNMYNHGSAFFKNGSIYRQSYVDLYASTGNGASEFFSCVIDLNGSTDYVEMYVRTIDTSGNPTYYASSVGQITLFGGYKLIGA